MRNLWPSIEKVALACAITVGVGTIIVLIAIESAWDDYRRRTGGA